MRIYKQDKNMIGFECNHSSPIGESESWINFTKTEKSGLYIDKFYGCCEPDLSAGNLRTLFAWMGNMVPVPARGRGKRLNGRGKSDI